MIEFVENNGHKCKNCFREIELVDRENSQCWLHKNMPYWACFNNAPDSPHAEPMPKTMLKDESLIEFVGEKADIVDQLVMWNRDVPNPFISLRSDGTIEISDEFAEAIKAKIMPKCEIANADTLSGVIRKE